MTKNREAPESNQKHFMKFKIKVKEDKRRDYHKEIQTTLSSLSFVLLSMISFLPI